MARNKKFYAVRSGYARGVYCSWEDCKAQVDGYSNADYKRFSTRTAAEAYLNEGIKTVPMQMPQVGSRDQTTVPTNLEAANPQRTSLKQVVIYADGACKN